ncbi:uncharacterized protein HMPREF1541_10343 [Cyphellophora europaea CBS 101466]|uniref:Uncharacterized protein n=1 Tax=Cyphellophora europaea (strain CBS 101466) TaxID=1220924 RepID=W2S9G2_CYPE1|nr:uncharacterized protein HMPREF1541_10343 [Cyphellophora europaea CBS 101466]ETN44673.1 hypothetical protein HMPREF1541_10343 [Cyphellophora europaea CBS 101466]
MDDRKGQTDDQPASKDQQLCIVQHAGTRQSVELSRPVSILHTETQRACGLTPQSVTLLGHYLRDTASFLAMTSLRDNPYVTVLMPLGYTDDILMHGLLALSGALLTYRQPGNVDLANATRLHYGKLISGLRGEFVDLENDDLEKKERLLRISLVACHYEAVSGDTHGTFFAHLRASQTLVHQLPPKYAPDLLHRSTMGLSMETLTYLMICNTITPSGFAADCTMPLNDFFASLDDSLPTFGALFAGAHELYRMIPDVSLLASQRLTEETAGPIHPSLSLKSAHDSLHQRITCWTMPPPPLDDNTDDWEHKRNSAEAYRHALHIYLATALSGSTVSDPAVKSHIEQHIIRVFKYVVQLVASQYTATLLWPTVVAGSCMTKASHREALVSGMSGDRWRMRQVKVLVDVLQLLWDDPDPRAYGPYGLQLIMEKHGIKISIS